MTTWEISWVIVSIVGAFVGGRSVLIWGTLTYLMGWPVVMVLLAIGMKPKTWERRGERLQAIADKLEEMSKPKEYQDFNTVDDLMKQLQNK
jgi:hypothetical protein